MLESNIQLKNKCILVTGAAGFIGANLIMALLKMPEPLTIVGLDSVNDYYDISLKEYRLEAIEALAKERPGSGWTFVKGNLAGGSMTLPYKTGDPARRKWGVPRGKAGS